MKYIVEGGKVRELAEPGTDNTELNNLEGVKEQEVTAPAENTTEAEESSDTGEAAHVGDTAEAGEDTSDSSGDTESEETEDGQEEQKVQSAEERRRNAAARRAREQEAEKIARQAQIDEAYRTAYASKGVNKYIGRPIESEADFKEYQLAFQRENTEKRLSSGKLDIDTLNTIISESPVVKDLVERNKALEAERAEIGIKQVISEIHALDPDINSVDDLLNMPAAAEFNGLVEKGIPLKQAYLAVNHDKLTKRAVEAARQSVINSGASKSHLKATAQKGVPEVSVPDEVYANYKALMPELTRKEIEEHYRKHQ